MPYTLAKLFVWLLAAAIVGGLVGWALRALRARRDLAAARASAVDVAELERLRAEHNRLTEQVTELQLAALGVAGDEPVAPPGAGVTPSGAGAAPAPDGESTGVDLEEARRVLGHPVALDDFEVVEGIGPRIAQVLHAAGITTWAELAASTPEQLKAVLDAAGDRFRVHDPASWPRQAELAARGDWQALKQLGDDLTAGGE